MGLSIAEALSGLPFVREMGPLDIAKLVAVAKEVGFEKDQIIFREGDTSRQFYIVLSGKVALEITTLKGPYRLMTVEGGGELGWSFLLSKGVRRFRARATERVEALVFDGTALQRTCEEDPALGYRLTKRVLQVVSERLEATRLHFLDLIRLEV
jgi:CRP/FNR family transcriptional regulator, cyclic AMP receptor protein